MSARRVAVIGGGINGLAVARQLMLDHARISVAVFEKESDVALHQSSHNSGVVHAGLYYEPGSLKARLCARGRDLIKEYCATHSLPYNECGKLVVALSEDELPHLENIFRKSVANGVPNIRIVDAEEIGKIEPNCIGIKALYSPRTAIVNYSRIAQQFAIEIRRAGSEIRLNANVTRIVEANDGVVLEGDGEPLHEAAFDHVISCAGLQSDRLAKISGDSPDPKIVPFFGQYYVIDRAFRDHVRGLIYPVPDPRFPFLGVHFTKRIDGEMTIGPNAFISFGRENYSGRCFNLKDVGDFLLYPGFWRFAVRNVPVTLRELKTVISDVAFVREAAKYVPSLSNVAVSPAVRGIRAQAMMGNGSLVDDFVIRRCGRVTHVRNAPSPGATSSMAIAEYITREILAFK
ncbi:L-2-hydroxyglutarate oxidase [Bradyrhizobium sp. Pear77]|uniref:L-2-hydroxyglutarate oxidase n=1 Tax=Bradyrhizobium altum TaxID=1571202 RepID=UPI001E5887A4|nr:L-2-hydroxyglutarate oxidase [Bradyrhizobium altum]MCC8957527.1 L-2-hydroxyglutarate oxidase [Bradyrhizobium altum]